MRAIILSLMLAVPWAANAADTPPKNEWVPSWQDPKDGFDVTSRELGSGTPQPSITTGFDRAAPVSAGLYHVPGTMPGFPTAATLWPKVVQVNCSKRPDDSLACDGYDVKPQDRGEYIYVKPSVKEPEHASVIYVPVLEQPTPKHFKKKHRRHRAVIHKSCR